MGAFKPRRGTGELGYTDLFLKRVPKTHLLVKLNALLDELGAVLGVLRSRSAKRKRELLKIQKELVRLSAFVAGYGKKTEVEAMAASLLRETERAATGLELKGFVLFGEDVFSAGLNLARAKARICEIIAWQARNRTAAVYLNRLSDYLFALSAQKKSTVSR